MHRAGPTALLPWRDALAEIFAVAQPLPATSAALTRALAGQVLAAPVACGWDLPQAGTSTMDGYAVHTDGLARGSEGVAMFEIVGESAAGRRRTAAVPAGAAVRIFTGAVVPAGCNVVVPQEDTTADGSKLRVDLARFGVVQPGRWTRAKACDFSCGDEALAAGTLLGPGDLALAASVGATELTVHRPPTVAVLSTGDELVPVGQRPAPGQVVSSNALMLAAAADDAGANVRDLGIAPDDPDQLHDALREGLRADVLLTSGGISVGDHDLVRQTLEALGATCIFHGVNVRPGKPLAYARHGDTHVIALPGNPASSLVGFALLVRPLLRRLLGLVGELVPQVTQVTLRNAARGAGRRAHLLRARLHADGSATALTTQISGNLGSIRDFDALVEVPPGVEQIPAGSVAGAIVTEPRWIERRARSSARSS